MGTFFGLYRGVVMAIKDPTGRGRIQVSVPEILDEGYTAWAALSVPLGGAAPAALPLGVQVWIEFEHGDPKFPVVTGLIVG
jgi:uncharacterized protein involved in type VI secretion and phage assembly